MAVLSKIRKRSLLVIAVVGIALFAFVLMDLIGSGSFGNSGRYVGSINGKDIPTEEFRFKVANQQEQNKSASASMISNSIWNQEVKTALYEEQFEKLGLRAGEAQIKGALEKSGNTMFLDELGKFSQDKFNQYVEMIKSQYPTQWRLILEDYEISLGNFVKEQTYNTLVKAGINATAFDGKMAYERENNKVSFDYVAISYATINDDEVPVSDADIIEYMKKRKNQYKGDDSRDFEYILIESKASDEDIKEIEQNVTSLLNSKTVYNEATQSNETVPGFAEVEDVKEFVNSNSDIPFNEKYIFAKDLPAMTDASVGSVTSLYKENNYVKISRILDSKMIADSVKSSHIIIPYQGALNSQSLISEEEAKKKADSIFNLVKNNDEKFREIANEINTDGTKGNGGDIGWVMYSQITYEGFDKDFAEFIFFNPKGSIQVVKTQFGYHIIKVDDTGSTQPAYKVATIAQAIEPSSTTNDSIYAFSQKLEMEAQTKSLADLATEHNLTVVPVNGITAIEENVVGLGAQRGIVQWAFSRETKKENVRRFDISQGHVIAKLKNINENGLQSVEKNRTALEPLVRNEKKATMIKGKIQSGSSLEEIAQANNVTVKSSVALSLANPMIQGLGQEPKVVGTALSLASGQTSGVIEGKTGVYVVRTKSIVKAPELPNYITYSNRIKTQSQNLVQGKIITALKNQAEIKDNRIYLGF